MDMTEEQDEDAGIEEGVDTPDIEPEPELAEPEVPEAEGE